MLGGIKLAGVGMGGPGGGVGMGTTGVGGTGNPEGLNMAHCPFMQTFPEGHHPMTHRGAHQYL